MYVIIQCWNHGNILTDMPFFFFPTFKLSLFCPQVYYWHWPCSPMPRWPYYLVCQKKEFMRKKFQDVLLHLVAFYSMQTSMLFWLLWPTILRTVSHRLSCWEMTDRWQLSHMTEDIITDDSTFQYVLHIFVTRV